MEEPDQSLVKEKKLRGKRGPYKKKIKFEEPVKQEPRKRGRKKTDDNQYIE